MLPGIRPLFSGLVLLGSVATASAQLHWSTREIQREVVVGAQTVEAAFPFTNPGTKPVTILQIQPDCGCTTATLTKTVYAPGEAGEIKVVFTIGDRVGPQTKTVWVLTDDNPKQAEALVLRVNIPPLLTLEPRVVWWPLGKAEEEKVVTIQLHPGAGITLSDVACTNPAMTHRLEAAGADLYRLHLKPVSTAQPVKARLWFRASLPGHDARTFMIFARVQ